MYQYCYPLGSASASYHLFCCIVQTNLSADLALRPQYQCCFHKITKSANYTIPLYIESVLILSSQEFSTNVNHSKWFSAWRVKDYRYEHGKISCYNFHLKLLALTHLNELF